MTSTQQTGPAAAPRPFKWTMLAPTLAVDVVAPIAVFTLLQARGAPPIWALAGGALPPILNNMRVWLESRRLEPLGIMIVAFGLIGVVASLVSGNLFFSLIKDSFLTGAFGLIFLGSLLLARPLMFYVIRQFVAGGDEVRIQAWKGLWRYAAFRTALRRLTIIWGLVYLAEALIRIPLALTLAPRDVVTISPIMGFGATLILIRVTRSKMRATRAHLELAEHVKWPL
jgi:hypothetical protein